MKKYNLGLTLTELVVVLAIIGIMTVMAMPSYTYLRKSIEASLFHHDFLNAYNTARSSATTYQQSISMCGSSSLTALCDHNWSKGIAVFVDNNDNRRHEVGEKVLSFYPSHIKFASTKLRISFGLRVLNFTIDRGLPSGSYGSFSYCSDEPKLIRSFIFNKMGNYRFAQDSNGDGVRDNNGVTIDCS